MGTEDDILEKVTSSDYKYGFVTDVEMDIAPKGLNEDIIRMISKKKNEPESMLEWRTELERWLQLVRVVTSAVYTVHTTRLKSSLPIFI